MEVTVKELRKPAIVSKLMKLAPSGNSKLAGRKIVPVTVASVPSVGDKNAFVGICTLSFHLVAYFTYS